MDKNQYMRRAMELAGQGCGWTNPNPMVGCVVVKDGRIIAEGYHPRCGEFHAERNALLNCKEDPAGADLYVTLEPCFHHGKTPPCTDIILEKKIARVFVGAMDSNPLVGGKGVKILREHGVFVETGILEEECRRQNEVFFHNMEKHRPFIAMKYAMTLDGKIACATGDSRWVTGPAAREHVHGLRHRYMGIMVGIGTVLADDPLLNCRIPGGKDPVRIICDSNLRLPLDSQLVKTAGEIPTYVFAAGALDDGALANRAEALKGAGLHVVFTSGSQVNIREMLTCLAEEKIDSILLEGGGTLNSSFLEQGLVDRVYAYVAPKLIGGAGAKTPVEGKGISWMKDAVELADVDILSIGEDICITGHVRR